MCKVVHNSGSHSTIHNTNKQNQINGLPQSASKSSYAHPSVPSDARCCTAAISRACKWQELISDNVTRCNTTMWLSYCVEMKESDMCERASASQLARKHEFETT